MATSTQIVWTYIFELAFLHESLNGSSLAGTGLIMGYMLVVAVIKMIPVESAEEETEPLISVTVSARSVGEEELEHHYLDA